MCENCVIEKSAASDACFPSLASMPIPACAACIMETSFPPSPIAATRAGFLYRFRRLTYSNRTLMSCAPQRLPLLLLLRTIEAFCSGEQRQQTTAVQAQTSSATSAS